MATEKQKNRMLEYLVESIRDSGQNAEPNRRQIVPTISKETAYIDVDDNGTVFLIDMPYPQQKISGRLKPTIPSLYHFAKAHGRPDVAAVFYKDGKTFFRNAAEDKSWKKYGKSLKNYARGGNNYNIVEGLDPMQRMIFMRPEEKYVLSMNRRLPFVQYYQPDSARLEEMLVSFHFNPVTLDYSHETASEQRNGYKPENRVSEKLNVWDRKYAKSGPLYLEGGFLRGKND